MIASEADLDAHLLLPVTNETFWWLTRQN